jgi:tetratricopeptide (TPR) repeat protein
MENSAVEIFFSFVDDDRDFYQQIQRHLNPLVRQKRVHLSSSEDIHAGDELAKSTVLLEGAKIIALLVSPAYLQSDQHYHEMELAMQQHQVAKATVVPILLKLCSYKDAPFAKLQVLPRNEKPISQWSEKSEEAFQEIVTELSYLLPELPLHAAPDSRAAIWTVPYPQNTLFTGREAELEAIETTLRQGKNAAIGQTQAISGLGGIGKTQIALEYAYRHRQDYRSIFWVLADTRDTLSADYSKIAELLDLPGKNQPELHYIIQEVKRWLENNQDWLLILDNADDLSIIPAFLPPSTAPGHVLLTTRSQSLGRLAERIEARKLDTEEGVAFLLQRSGCLNKRAVPEAIDPKEHEAARQIVRELGGLPLALDQAGAYIEDTSCGFQGYLVLYRKEHKELLKVRGGHVADHPDSVTQTVQIALKKIATLNPSAADLLRLCAFLAPEDIPELVIERGEAEFTGPLKQLARKPLKLNTAIADLQKYSLISRNAAAKTLTVHRVVQMVLKDTMTKNTEQAWATRTVRIMRRIFPWPEVEVWEVCRQLLPHAQECVAQIERWQMETRESGLLLNSVGSYLLGRAEYSEAQKYYAKALVIDQKVFGKGHLNTAASLDNLAIAYREQGKYEQAEILHKQALAISRKALGDEHLDTAKSLNNLAGTYREQGKYEQAEILHKQALAIRRKALGDEHLDTAKSLNNLASTYREQGKYEQAEILHKQALAIRRKAFGDEHLDTSWSLNNLALTYLEQGKYEQAASLHRQALAIERNVLGDEHPDTAKSLNNLAEVYLKQEKYDESEQLHQQALIILQKILGNEHPLVATSLNNRGELYFAQERYEEAKDLFQQALLIQRKVWDEKHPDTARTLHNMGCLSQALGSYAEACVFFEQALEMRRARLGEEHLKTRETLARYEEMVAVVGEKE